MELKCKKEIHKQKKIRKYLLETKINVILVIKNRKSAYNGHLEQYFWEQGGKFDWRL